MILRGMIVYDYHYRVLWEWISWSNITSRWSLRCEIPWEILLGAILHQGEAWDVRYHEKSYLEQYHIKVKPEMWDTMRNLTWSNITSRWSLRCEIPWEILLGAISHQGEAWDVRYHEKSYLEQYHIKVKPEMWDTMRNLTWSNITSRWSLRCEIPWEILLGAISHQGEAWDVRYHEKSYLEQYHIKVKSERCEIPWEILLGALSGISYGDFNIMFHSFTQKPDSSHITRQYKLYI